MLRMVIRLSLCHVIFIAITLLGMISVISAFVVLIISLFRTKATPAELPGRNGSPEFSTLSLLEYSDSIWVSCSLVRCVSWRQSTPIFFSLITCCIVDHFEIVLFPRSGDARPLIFSVAMSMFALDFFFFIGF